MESFVAEGTFGPLHAHATDIKFDINGQDVRSRGSLNTHWQCAKLNVYNVQGRLSPNKQGAIPPTSPFLLPFPFSLLPFPVPLP